MIKKNHERTSVTSGYIRYQIFRYNEMKSENLKRMKCQSDE